MGLAGGAVQEGAGIEIEEPRQDRRLWLIGGELSGVVWPRAELDALAVRASMRPRR